MGKVFIDTNILIYLFASDDALRRSISLDVLMKHDCIISSQVISEFCYVCAAKKHHQVQDVLHSLDEVSCLCRIYPVLLSTSRLALTLHKRYGYHFYDCQIIASAIENECERVISEDMNDGQKIGPVVIENIFKRI